MQQTEVRFIKKAQFFFTKKLGSLKRKAWVSTSLGGRVLSGLVCPLNLLGAKERAQRKQDALTIVGGFAATFP